MSAITSPSLYLTDRFYRVHILDHRGKEGSKLDFATYAQAKKYLLKKRIKAYSLNVIFPEKL